MAAVMKKFCLFGRKLQGFLLKRNTYSGIDKCATLYIHASLYFLFACLLCVYLMIYNLKVVCITCKTDIAD